MDPRDLASLPWPAILALPGGALAFSPGAEELLGFSEDTASALARRLEMEASPGERPAGPAWAPGHHWIEGPQRWRDRRSGRTWALRVKATPVEGGVLLALEPRAPELPEAAASAHRARTSLEALHLELLAGRSEVPLRELLRKVVELACELTGARYGALGVLARDGATLRDFVYVGMSEQVARRIGHLPEGKGLLGAVIREGRTLRVADLTTDPRSAGVPAHHPAMHSFLGAPLRTGERIFGNFYLAEKQGAPEFTEADARHLERFSAQAALTVALAEQAEEEQRHLFRALVENAPYGIVFYPAGADPPFGNPAAERMLGRISLEDDPARLYELQRPDGGRFGPGEGPGPRALRGETTLNLEARIARAGGAPFPALVSAAPVLSQGGSLLGAVVVYQDISTLKELERLRVEFAALVAHDMRSPVQSVMLQVESLLRRARGEAAWVPVATLQNMRRSGQHLSRLIGDLLDASRLESGQLRVDRRHLEVEEALRLLLQRIGAALGPREVVVEVRGAPVAFADPFRFEQILTNLLENAGKYSRAGAPIRVVLAEERGGARIAVSDQGAGIAADELPHLFDRYYRGRAAAARPSGLGLGLYITRGLVQAHGGTLTARSAPGRGSTFELWLPGQPDAAAAEPASPPG